MTTNDYCKVHDLFNCWFCPTRATGPFSYEDFPYQPSPIRKEIDRALALWKDKQ